MTTLKDIMSAGDLVKLKSTVAPEPAQRPTPSKADTADDDLGLFRQAMAGVVPLKTSKIATSSTATKKNPKDPNAMLRRAAAMGGKDDTPSTALSDMHALLNPVASEAFLTYKHPTLPTKTFEQLKQGKLRWYEAVDLHSTNIDEARVAVLQLIQIAKDANQTVVKIVHGKGDALIKTCVNGWLRQIDEVLAFVSATAKDGGTGAVLVLLKRQKDQDRPPL